MGVFRLIFSHRDLTNTHDIPALAACVQKRMAESRVISRHSEVIYRTDEGAFRLKSGQNEE